jgi:hypothetical protein
MGALRQGLIMSIKVPMLPVRPQLLNGSGPIWSILLVHHLRPITKRQQSKSSRELNSGLKGVKFGAKFIVEKELIVGNL